MSPSEPGIHAAEFASAEPARLGSIRQLGNGGANADNEEKDRGRRDQLAGGTSKPLAEPQLEDRS